MVEHTDLFSTLDENSEVTSYLNHAALAEMRAQSKLDFIRELNPKRVIQIAEEVAQRVLGIPDDHKVIFSRNTTEAYAISIEYLSSLTDSVKVSLPFDSYSSIIRATSSKFNYGEKNRETTYSVLEPEYSLPDENNVNDIFSYDQTLKGIEEHILRLRPDVIIFSRTNRINGREQNSLEYVNLIKGVANSIDSTYDPYIIADSAQTLTTTDTFHIDDITFQVGCFHKGLGSFHPLGFAITKRDIYYELVEHLKTNANPYFPSNHTFINDSIENYGRGVVPIESYYCFLETLNYLSNRGLIEGVDFTSEQSMLSTEYVSFQNLIDYRKQLYQKAYFALRDIDTVKVTSDFPTISTGYILSFEIDIMSVLTPLGLTKKLKESGIYVTFISETNEVRISFGPNNTSKDVDNLIGLIQQYL